MDDREGESIRILHLSYLLLYIFFITYMYKWFFFKLCYVQRILWSDVTKYIKKIMENKKFHFASSTRIQHEYFDMILINKVIC